MAVIMGQAGCFALEPPYLYEMYVVIALLAVLPSGSTCNNQAASSREQSGKRIYPKVGEIKYGKD